MDIYSFINSKHLGEYCRSKMHSFSPLEQCVIVSMSNRTLEEKHNAYNAIMSIYPDEPISGIDYCSTSSLHDCIRFVITRGEHIRNWFLNKDENAFYHAGINRTDRDYYIGKKFYDEIGYYSTFEQAWLKSKDAMLEDSDIIIIEKRILDTDMHASFTISAEGELIDICAASESIFDENPGDQPKPKLFSCFKNYFLRLARPR